MPSPLAVLAMATMLLSAPACRPAATGQRPLAPNDPASGPRTAPAHDENEDAHDRLRIRAQTFADLAGWSADAVGQAVPPLLASCSKLAALADDDAIGRSPLGGRASDWRAPCAEARNLDITDHAAARAFFEKHFTPFMVTDKGRAEGRFSGYYEAALRGSRQRHGRYQHPVYRRPPDLVTVHLNDFLSDSRSRKLGGRVVDGRLVPYATRTEIDAGALANRGLELLWVDDPVDAFFAQVQGSGRVLMDDGSTVRIGFAGKNGHPYTAIGRVLIAWGELTRATVSMQSIRQWIVDHPDRADELMRKNQSFVFFEISKNDAPTGSQGVPLTAERSMAVDREFIPASTPVWVDIHVPVAGTRGQEQTTFQRLLIAQDTGGAILGPVRGDIYWGGTERAADIAGHMKSRGRYHALVPRAAVERGDLARILLD